jgi:multiple sugar transport system permease protein
MRIERETGALAQVEPTPNSALRGQGLSHRAERLTGSVFLLPAVLALLFLSIFPLIVSLYISLSRFRIARGGFELTFVGLTNYHKLLFGAEKSHFLGLFAPTTFLHWLVFGLVGLALLIFLGRYLRSSSLSFSGVLGRSLLVIVLAGLAWMVIHTLGPGGRLGTLSVTLVYVFVGIFFQYTLGLGLALLTAQHLPGRRFFRVVFLLPMMITPVGVAYMFRMVTDTGKGPFTPLWQAFGLSDFSWVNYPWGARTAILIGDIWQWTPFMFIVLLAALESQSLEPFEAAIVDGANRWQIFRYITWPEILPVSLTLILIRLIEAFKIVDLPNVMTNGGPGTATESMTLQAFISWRSLDLGSSAAVAYLLLLTVTFFSLILVNLVRQRTMANL